MEPLDSQDTIHSVVSLFRGDENIKIIKGKYADLLLKKHDLRIRIKKCGFRTTFMYLSDPQMNGSLTDISQLCEKLLNEYEFLTFTSNGWLIGTNKDRSDILAKYPTPTFEYLAFLMSQLDVELTGKEIEETTETELRKELEEESPTD